MASKPPKQMTVQLQREDVARNLVDVVATMESVRRESIKNFGASDEVKLDYLRLASELASCIEPIINEDGLADYTERVVELFDGQPLLWFYDSLQTEFWHDVEPALQERLDDLSVVLLRDNFVSDSQPYQVFQGIKYLAASDENRGDVSASIQPFNSLLFEELLVFPEVAQYVMQKLFLDYVDKSEEGVGMSVNGDRLDSPDYVKRLGQLGALFVDVPYGSLPQMRGEFERTTVIGDGQDRKARVLFAPDVNGVSEENMFDLFNKYAVVDLGDLEDSLSGRVTNVHSFGKKFLNGMKKEMGLSEGNEKGSNKRKTGRVKGSPKIERRDDVYVVSNIRLYGLDGSLHTEYSEIMLDAEPVSEGGNIAVKTQDGWLEFYNGNDKFLPSLPLFYAILEVVYDNKDDSVAQELLRSLEDDFSANWLTASTRFNYGADKVWHNYNTDEQVEFDVHIPGVEDYIENFVCSEEWEQPLRSMFMAGDLEKIPKVFTLYDERKGYLWIPSDNTNVERAAFVGFLNDIFSVFGNYLLNDSGRSRGVGAGGAWRAK